MSFYSTIFILFMTAVFLMYWGMPHKYRWVFLSIVNAVFYLCFDYRFILVLLFITLFTYLCGIAFEKRRVPTFLFTTCILVTLSMLLVFKYLNFVIYTITKISAITGLSLNAETIKLIMPVGISFYTFESLSYICDVKKGKIKAERNPLKYWIYLSFFPTVTSGPIERADHFITQLSEEKHFSYETAKYGMRLLLLGLFKKLVCADLMVKYINNVFDNVIAHSGTVFIIAIFMYTFEIYFDFSGYTDMARGIAYLLGFELFENFKAPYLATSIKEFWGRWHISLSSWLRDYVYIPLGGNRCSKLRKNINILITFFVSGLWHGASFTFIVWGMIHGFVQCIEGCTYKLPRIVRQIITFCIVAFAWMFFRINSLSEAFYVIGHMLPSGSLLGAFQEMGMTKLSIVKCGMCIVLIMLYDIFSEKKNLLKEIDKLHIIARWLIYTVVAVLTICVHLHEGSNASFIYFQF